MRTLLVVLCFAGFLWCGMLSLDGFLGQLSPLAAGAGYALLAVVCVIWMAKLIVAKDAQDETQHKT